MNIAHKLDQKFTSVDKDTKQLKNGLQIPGKYKVLEEWTQDTTSYATYLIYNDVFRKLISIKAPRTGQFRRTKDFLVMVSLWMKISDHPNIQTIHYIEMLNETPQVAMEYMAAATLERSLLLLKNWPGATICSLKVTT